ncbi:MAG: Tfx family DNA-binding protein [Candidatus Hydrothermarchaeales archaeon]
MPEKDTILTERQMEILKLRRRGYSQTEIAKKLGTSRANISATEKTALKNIEKAKNTLEVVKMIEAPIWLTFGPEEDLDDVVGRIYSEAGKRNIWIAHDGPSLSNLIHDKAGKKIKGRRILSKLEITITEEGDVIVR